MVKSKVSCEVPGSVAGCRQCCEEEAGGDPPASAHDYAPGLLKAQVLMMRAVSFFCCKVTIFLQKNGYVMAVFDPFRT